MGRLAKPDNNSENPDNRTRTQKTADANKAKLLESLKKNYGLIHQSCKAAGVHHSTYYTYMDTDSEFAAEVEDILELEVDAAEHGLIKLMDCGEPKVELGARKIFLDAKAKKRGYGTQKTELSGELNNKVVYVNSPSNSRIPPRP